MSIRIRNDFKALIPPLSEDEYRQLEQNILKDGIRDPLVVWDDILVDGHNRYEIAQKHHLSYECVHKNFADENEAIRWIILNQFGRRNLSAYDRSILALKLKPVIAERAKENQGRRNDLTFSKNLEEVHTGKELAKVAGVSDETIRKVEKIERDAPAELKQAVKSGEKSINQAYKEIKLEEKKAEREAAITQQIDKPKSANHVDIDEVEENHYRVVYADPPWSYNDECKDGGVQSRGAVGVYPTMSINEICYLPVNYITEDNAVLFLWVTSPLLEDAFKVIKAWGFKYKSSFVWDKVAHNMGHYNSVRHEFLLICTKGSCTPDVVKLFDSVVSIERTEHSKKPKEFRDMIDTLYPVGERLEMFAREAPDGWDVWGNMA